MSHPSAPLFEPKTWSFLKAQRSKLPPLLPSVTVENVNITLKTGNRNAGEVGRLLDYLDFLYRWAASIDNALSEGGVPKGAPLPISGAALEIIEAVPGSWETKMRSLLASPTLGVVVMFTTLASGAATTVTAVDQMIRDLDVDKGGQASKEGDRWNEVLESFRPPTAEQDERGLAAMRSGSGVVEVQIRLSDGQTSTFRINLIDSGSKTNNDAFYLERFFDARNTNP